MRCDSSDTFSKKLSERVFPRDCHQVFAHGLNCWVSVNDVIRSTELLNLNSKPEFDVETLLLCVEVVWPSDLDLPGRLPLEAFQIKNPYRDEDFRSQTRTNPVNF